MPAREHLDVHMQPLSGARFQPTGFPDVGAARFQRPIGEDGWQDCLLLESAQSMANHLEATSWDGGTQQPVSAFADLPYVRVLDGEGGYLTSSRTEPHRLNSAYIRNATLTDSQNGAAYLSGAMGLAVDKPAVARDIAATIFRLDPMCLVHGVFFTAKPNPFPGNPKIARALTSSVEAHDVRSAISGGVKRDHVQHSQEDGGGTAAEGYGFVPFHRTEYVAREIVASFAFDLDQLASYGLPEPATELLATAARWEVRRLLDGGFRPRTACDLVIVDPASVDSALPTLAVLTDQLADLVRQCSGLLGGGKPLEVTWGGSKAKTKKATA